MAIVGKNELITECYKLPKVKSPVVKIFFELGKLGQLKYFSDLCFLPNYCQNKFHTILNMFFVGSRCLLFCVKETANRLD